MPNTGLFELTWTFDTVGPMARSVADLAAMLAVMAGFDPAAPGSVACQVDDYAAELGRGVGGLRIGVPGRFSFEPLGARATRGARGSRTSTFPAPKRPSRRRAGRLARRVELLRDPAGRLIERGHVVVRPIAGGRGVVDGQDPDQTVVPNDGS